MTNNELAKAVCRGYNYHGKLTPQGVAGFVVDRCTETANKKDQQFAEIIKEECNASYESGYAEGTRNAEKKFKAFLEEMRDSLDLDYHKDSYEGNAYKHSVIMGIINELFKED